MNIEGLNNNNLTTYLDSLGFNPAQIEDISQLITTDPNKALEIIESYSANTGTPVGGEIPDLDLPEALDFIQENLEKILGLLQMECDEEQLQIAKDRIEAMKDKIEASHQEQLDKINEQLEEAQKADKNSKVAKAFAWIGAIFAVAMAVVASVLTGGATAGLAIAGAVLAITTLAMQETGAMEDFGKALLENIEKNFPNMSKKSQKIFAAVSQMLIMIAMSATLLVGGGAAAGLANMPALMANALSETATTVVNALTTGTGIVLGAANVGTSVAGTVLNNKAANLSAEVKEIQAFLTMLQQTMDEEQEILQQLMQDLQNSVGAVIALLEKDNDNMTQLLNNLSANAAMV